MLVLLPKGKGLQSIEESLTTENLAEWKSMLRNQTVNVSMPKFKLETAYELGTTLSDMGMPTAFDPGTSDLSGISNDNLFVEAAIHKAFVEVNEEGTEAAGATGILLGPTSVQIYPDFNANHPFVFLIQDSETGSILFVGRIMDPSK